jgi:heme/copper-type cytochrome/quinol oxidase subunit 3
MIRSSNQVLPQEARLKQGAWLFLGMLGVFFVSCMILFVVYVALRADRSNVDAAALRLPRGFIASSIILVAISTVLHLAVKAVRSEQQLNFQRCISIALILAIGFLITQGFGLSWLLLAHYRIDQPGRTLYGLTFFLSLVHALHVLGGVASMLWVSVKAWMLRYDHENYWGVVCCTWYWHFLDAVWIFMLICFWGAGFLLNRGL